jgi:hypothetical protein
MVIDSPLLSRGLTKRDDTYIVSPNGVNDGENAVDSFNKGQIPPPLFPAATLHKLDPVRVFKHSIGIIKVESVLPQVRFAFGFVPFVHERIVSHFSFRSA